MKRFNVTGNCDPDRHYMVDIRSKLAQIVAMVEIGGRHIFDVIV